MGKIRVRIIALGAFLTLIVLLFFAIFFPPSEETDLGNGFVYYGGHSRDIYYWQKGDSTTVYIPSDVLSLINTNEHIFVKQRPRLYDEAINPKFYDYSYGRDTVYYWFVDKGTKELTGPLSYSEMEAFLKRINLEDMINMLESRRNTKQFNMGHVIADH